MQRKWEDSAEESCEPVARNVPPPAESAKTCRQLQKRRRTRSRFRDDDERIAAEEACRMRGKPDACRAACVGTSTLHVESSKYFGQRKKRNAVDHGSAHAGRFACSNNEAGERIGLYFERSKGGMFPVPRCVSPDRGGQGEHTNEYEGSVALSCVGHRLPVIHELHCEREVCGPQSRDDRLQIILVTTGHSHLIVHDLSLDLQLLIFDHGYDPFCIFLFDSYTELYSLTDGAPGSRFRGVVLERFQVNSALDKFGLQDIDRALQVKIIGCGYSDHLFLLVEVDRRVQSLQIVSLSDFISGLVDGVVDLLKVNVGDDIERTVLSHYYSLSQKLHRRQE